ncbi:metallophosphoesterase [Bifidobacterium scaligerum]|uniref:Serine/threonine protein phosphatase n=1 Tax=Bifidobacterium scaligerum TaxID=2052656 RepID=A0A2M9HNH5_9BIFI|nr:metallophosphoesterase [Bifidobacterium scaligerum]PJM78368.1 serine/threonine protein phosphatase [Bifidobacterium scaligerum]
MTEMQRAPEGMSTKPRIRPADADDDRPVSISARLGRLQFHHSGKFRVLQVADVQDGPKIAKDTITLLEASLDAARPDVVIFSGNQIAGYDPAFAGSFRKRRWSEEPIAESALEQTRALVRQAAEQLTAPLAVRGIPWAITYGNHDFQCGLSNAQLDDIYRDLPGCLNPATSTSTARSAEEKPEPPKAANVLEPMLPQQTIYTSNPQEPGTFALPVMDMGGSKVALGLVVLDSGDYVHGGGFGTPSAAAMEFLRKVPGLIGAKSVVFQHMPLPEYYQVLKPVAATAAFAMQGYRDHADTYYTLDDERVQPGGYLGEGISCPDRSEEFAILHDSEGYIGVSAGHDHRNGFVGEYEGLLLATTPTCGFNTYGPAPAKRAVRLIEFDIRHPYEPRTQLLEFGELVGKPSSRRAYTFAVNQAAPGEGEGDDLLRRPSLWSQLTGLFK